MEGINPMTLSVEQLSALKTQMEEELQEIQRQMDALYSARSKFLNSKSTIQDVSTYKENTPLLVPLTSSLYVPGTIQNIDKVIVELGTGYFCEKSVSSASDLIDRKITLVTKSLETIESNGLAKRKTLEQVVNILQYKVAMLQESRDSSSKSK